MKARSPRRKLPLAAAATSTVVAAAALGLLSLPLSTSAEGAGWEQPGRQQSAAVAMTVPGQQPAQPAPASTAGDRTPTDKVPATPTRAPKAEPSKTPTTSKAPVRASAPVHLRIPSVDLSADVTRYTNADVVANGGAVKPPTLFSVSWWSGGGAPGTDADNTVYLYGHTWKEPAVFNRLKELRPGARVHVTTARGELTYLVDGQFTVDKPDLPTHPKVRAAVPGRLLLIGCYRETGNEDHTTDNIVVSARLL